MQIIETDILPSRTRFVNIKGPNEENLEAICVYMALGFFLDSDTFWKNKACLSPRTKHTIDNEGFLLKSDPYFEWFYQPETLSLGAAVDKYEALLKEIVKSQVQDNNVILPLSGGLDSRSQALILRDLGNPVEAFSYGFENGYKEYNISKQIAKSCGFNFKSYTIKNGYLWDSIDQLATINGCYSEFTHPRQMAVHNDLKQMKGVFSLGHWGDVFFDRGVPEGTTTDQIVPLLFKKMVKKYGFDLGEQLWKHWNLDGHFKEYLVSRIEASLSKIKIDNVSAKVRAFKTEHWAHRWTTTNLSIFEDTNPITLPYYDNRMCEFVCRMPEEYLADRKMQIAHLKRDKRLSSITWEAQKPFNINTFQHNKTPYNLPYRVTNKLYREMKSSMGKSYVQRNWELQFVGEQNDSHLKGFIFEDAFNNFIPKSIVNDVYQKFKNVDPIHYAHPLSMLLTLSLWNKHFKTIT